MNLGTKSGGLFASCKDYTSQVLRILLLKILVVMRGVFRDGKSRRGRYLMIFMILESNCYFAFKLLR